MDGVRHDYVDQPDLEAFRFLNENGLKAKSLIPVYQSSTFPSHVSMATGVTPEKHGIMHNSFYDRSKGTYSYSADADWIQSPPIWAILEKQNIKTATYFWVGSETDWRGIDISYSKAPFNIEIGEEEKLNQIINWLTLKPEQRPRLIMSWWRGTDSVSHRMGSTHPSVYEQLRKQDKILKKLIEEIGNLGLWNEVTLLVLSDHGMSDVSNFIDIKKILNDSSIDARISLGPAVGHIFLNNKGEKDKAIQALKANQYLSAWPIENLPSAYNMSHKDRTGDVVVTTTAPNMLVRGIISNPPKGMHGYNPSINDEMDGIFFAYGAGVKNKKIGKINQIDIAPTILNLLRVKIPEHMTGQKIDLN